MKSATSTIAAISKGVFAAGSDTIKVGLIGCGNRGTGAAKNCVESSSNVEVVAMGDVFADKVEQSLKILKTNDAGDKSEWSSTNPWKDADKVKVTKECCFSGFDAYKKVIDVPGVNLIILAAPPQFRPAHLKAAIEAGKNVFMEKPVAVDPVGIRSVIASSELASQKGLAIVAGTQRRHQPSYIEMMKRVHAGDIGALLGGECYWNMGCVRQWHFFNPRQPGWTDMEWMLRNWYYFTWLSGDHIVEQHVHNIDVINWAMRAHPVSAYAMGGRQWRVEPEFGNIFDHFIVEFTYPNGARVLSMARQINNCTDRVGERIVGATGHAMDGRIDGLKPYEHRGQSLSPYVIEHADLIAGIRAGRPLNEGTQVAESTMTAILGRMSAYTGREIKWDWAMKASKLDLTPAEFKMGPMKVAPPAMPGQTQLV